MGQELSRIETHFMKSIGGTGFQPVAPAPVKYRRHHKLFRPVAGATQLLMVNNLKTLNIEYRVSPRRRSIGIMVTTEGQVVVTLPRGTSQADLTRALEKHRAWIEAKVAERQAAWGQLKEGEAYFLGEAFRLTVLRGATGAVTLNGQEIRVPLPEGADLWSRLVAWYAGAGLGAASGPGEPILRPIWALRRGRWRSRTGSGAGANATPTAPSSSTGASSCARRRSSTTWWCMNWRTC